VEHKLCTLWTNRLKGLKLAISEREFNQVVADAVKKAKSIICGGFCRCDISNWTFLIQLLKENAKAEDTADSSYQS
jgi:hypothetical protein